MPDQESATPVPDQPGQVTVGADGTFTSEQPKGTVRFTGLHVATERRISTTEWPTGVDPKGGKNAQDAVWNILNGWTLPLDDFNAKQLQVLEADGMFSIVK